MQQKKHDTNKLYSCHAPEVECISKGKTHKKYEFGCKVSVATTSRDNWIVGIQAHHGNPYDGHTLDGMLKFVNLKSDNRMDKNYLKGKVGDKINALLCGCGANIRKLIAAFFLSFVFIPEMCEKMACNLMKTGPMKLQPYRNVS